MFRSETNCEMKYGDECPVWIWNILVNNYKHKQKSNNDDLNYNSGYNSV